MLTLPSNKYLDSRYDQEIWKGRVCKTVSLSSVRSNFISYRIYSTRANYPTGRKFIVEFIFRYLAKENSLNLYSVIMQLSIFQWKLNIVEIQSSNIANIGYREFDQSELSR